MDGQLYIVEGRKGKTHLAYLYDGVLSLYCCPVHTVWACNCESPCPTKHDEDCGYPAGRDNAELWDKEHNEVTCPTCLRKALGKETAIPMAL